MGRVDASPVSAQVIDDKFGRYRTFALLVGIAVRFMGLALKTEDPIAIGVDRERPDPTLADDCIAAQELVWHHTDSGCSGKHPSAAYEPWD
jgi:hypothetical protein